jgi:hypothetical protein
MPDVEMVSQPLAVVLYLWQQLALAVQIELVLQPALYLLHLLLL